MIDKQELYRSEREDQIRQSFVRDVFKQCPIPEDDLLQNLGLFLSSKNLSRILFMNHIYKLQLETHGVIMEFGTRWGQNLSIFAALRGIYEPFNRMRKIIGFDTFTGFPSLSDNDNTNCDIMKVGGLACSPNYEEYLDKIMKYQEDDNPLSHIKKYEIRKGDATEEITKYLKENPETIVSLAFFDFDIYEPTKACLEALVPCLPHGAILAFDELCDHDSPGETKALEDVFGINNIKLKRLPFVSRVSYMVFEGY
ncbi:MAG: hypothetical protein M0R03_12760 [Novosphingobium sp.]|nr:hypothetical protein [Novosphingobium sp.]